MRYLEGQSGEQLCVCFSPDGSYVLTGTSNGRLHCWSLPDGELISTRRTIHSAVSALAFSPDGKLLAIGDRPAFNSPQSSIHNWSIEGEMEIVFRAVATDVYFHTTGLQFSPRGDLLVMTSGSRGWVEVQGQVMVQHVQREDHLWSHRPGCGALCCAWSPDGNLLAVGQGNQIISLWEGATGKQVAELAQGVATRAICFAPDGRTLICAGGRSVHLWDVATRELKTVLRGHEALLWGVAITPDGSQVLSGDRKSLVRKWDVAGQSETGCFNWEIGRINQLAISPDGMLAAAVGQKGAPIIWDLD